jgi:hypothetical protein
MIEASRTHLQRNPFQKKAMMTTNATPTKKRDRLQRWRNLLSSSSETDVNQANSFSSSSSPSASELFAPKPTMSPPSIVSVCSSFQTQSSHSQASSTSTANVLGRDFLNKALQLLSEQEQATIQEHILPAVEDIDSMLLNAFNAAKDKQRLCENRRWTFTIRGHIVRLGDEADKVVRWLDRFKQVGDIAVNADPMHAGLLWVGIRFLLEVQNIYLFNFSLYFFEISTVL